MNIGGVTIDFITAVFAVAIIYVLVRPGSKAVEMINGFAAAVTNLVLTVTDF